MPDLKSSIESRAQKYLNDTISHRQHLHRNPELSYREYKTSDYLKNELKRIGISYIRKVAGTGILAHIKGQKKGEKKIILRAELDALPINETSGLEYESLNKGIMHACGHDAHMAMLLTTARILYEHKEYFGGDLWFLFQPGEELAPGGASLVLKEGVLQDIKPHAIIAQHVLPELETGQFGFRDGKYMASSDELYIDISGKGGHAALPGASTDQVLIAATLVSTLKAGVKKLSGNKDVVLGIGKFIADGATNVIPGRVHIEGTLRTFDEALRKEIHHYLKETCSKAEEDMVSVGLEIRKGYPVLVNNKELTATAKELSEKINGKENTTQLDLRLSSEDFAYYSQEFPALFYRLGVKIPGKEIKNLHTSQFNIHEAAMEAGISYMSILALELLRTPNYELRT